MRMVDLDFQRLRDAIMPLDTAQRRERYRRGDFPRAERCKDLSMRYRWDLFWECSDLAREPFRNLLDSHIDTALRRIVSNLEKTP